MRASQQTVRQLLLPGLICCRGQLARRGRGELISAGNMWTEINNRTNTLTRSLMHTVRQGPHTHTHTDVHPFLTDDMQNTCRERLPFILDQTPASHSSLYRLHSSFLTRPPPVLLPSSITPTISSPSLPLCPSLSPSSTSCFLLPSFLSSPLLSHPSLCLHSCPSRLQMVLNGRITERNCLVNNSTGTRWAIGQLHMWTHKEGKSRRMHKLQYMDNILYPHTQNRINFKMCHVFLFFSLLKMNKYWNSNI